MLPSSEDVVITPLRSDDESLPPLNPSQFAPGVHFLSHDYGEDDVTETSEAEDSTESSSTPGRRDLLEYLINEDGSVVCKWCGELLPSRTHWYRHKYKFHISNPMVTTSLFKCHKCNLFFKSRKGYLGHVSTRHSRSEQRVIIEKDDLKPFRRGRRTSEDFQGNPEEYEKQREKEEKLVAEIIDRVKRECEAQGSTVSRKGYSRRSTVMNT
ncbi:hypothetical protein GE061_002843 [Apolygus lucorum]|uniref:C2H2-type domain-containing protein n=1 Tax=Apolygus lucorum TaxID=248454 RepID=A0A6A4JE29_APOLU|nr:hypothetical protein GE061_002843 [Apolygus lucorum]